MSNGTLQKFIPIREANKLTGLQPATLRMWADQNKVKSYKTPTGQRMFDKQNLLQLTCRQDDPQEKINNKVIYCRISSKKQSDDLERQIEYCRSKYPDHELLSDIALGINFKRKSLQTILERAMQGNLKELVVAHKDRLCRFGFDLLENVFKLSNTKLIILNQDNDCTKPSTEQELAEDLLSIVHIYSCRQMGKRRYNRKKPEDQKDQTEDESESEKETD